MAYYCSACSTDFAGLAAFDLHRTGEYGGSDGRGTRRCLTMEEMKAKTRENGNPTFEFVGGKVATFKTEEEREKLRLLGSKGEE